MKRLIIVGLGYVGLPLVLLAARKGFDVTGIDIDPAKLASIKKGKSYIDDVSNEDLTNSTAKFSDDISKVDQADVVIICVPTPVDELKQPDLGPINGALRSISPHLRPGTLVILESTVNPGVCDEVVIPLLEASTTYKVGTDIYLAHCPERINPGDSTWNVSNINRVVGANSKKELRLATELYESLIDGSVKPMQSLKEAEAVKVVENSFRDINIAFVNELAMSFHKLGINLENVIDGAATKPFAFMAHRPGCGVGGHCIPVDPYYLIEYAQSYGFEHRFMRLARDINEGMPAFTVSLAEEALNELKLPLNGTKVGLLGMSYKPNVGDSRESPAYVIRHLLTEAGCNLATYDPYLEKDSTHTLEDLLQHSDALIIATGHRDFSKKLTPAQLKKYGIKVIVDGRNLLKDQRDILQKNGIIYRGVGVQ